MSDPQWTGVPGQSAHPSGDWSTAAGQQPYPGYSYPAYSYPGYPPVVAVPQPTNGLAIASLVLSLAGIASCGLTSLVGAILGHVARRQIRERGESGDGLALAGIVCGWVILGLAVVGGTAYLAFIAWTISHINDLPGYDPTPFPS
ncbi:MAG TPA: DUF4190 domain-containing protein [Micromonosporaceae bacterium]